MMQRIFAFIRFAFIFIREMWNANIAVVKQVLSPTLRIRPGFISVPMTVRGDFEVTSYANSITLTPGTISVHIPDDRHAIVLHAIDIGDNADALRASCASALEIPIMAWSRGNNQAAAPVAMTSEIKTEPSDHVAPKADDKPSDINAGDSI